MDCFRSSEVLATRLESALRRVSTLVNWSLSWLFVEECIIPTVSARTTALDSFVISAVAFPNSSREPLSRRKKMAAAPRRMIMRTMLIGFMLGGKIGLLGRVDRIFGRRKILEHKAPEVRTAVGIHSALEYVVDALEPELDFLGIGKVRQQFRRDSIDTGLEAFACDKGGL